MGERAQKSLAKGFRAPFCTGHLASILDAGAGLGRRRRASISRLHRGGMGGRCPLYPFAEHI